MKAKNHSLFGLFAILATIFTSVTVSGFQKLADSEIVASDIELIQYQEAVLNAAIADESEILSSSRTVIYDPQSDYWRINNGIPQVRVTTFVQSNTFPPKVIRSG